MLHDACCVPHVLGVGRDAARACVCVWRGGGRGFVVLLT